LPSGFGFPGKYEDRRNISAQTPRGNVSSVAMSAAPWKRRRAPINMKMVTGAGTEVVGTVGQV
jgi:hypothetical protein